MDKRKAANRCRNCGHLLNTTNENLKHKQPNHSFYCPCRKPENGWQGHYPTKGWLFPILSLDSHLTQN